MFERFTDRSRRAVVLAQEEARLLHHSQIGKEHILLGLIHEGEGVAAQVLLKLGADLSRVRQTVIQLLSGYAGHAPEGSVAWTASSEETGALPGAARDPTPARSEASHEAAAQLRGCPDGPLFHDLLQAGEDMRALTLEALIACRDGDDEALEGRLGEVVRLAALSGDGAQLARLAHLVEIDDALQGIVQLRPRDRPS